MSNLDDLPIWGICLTISACACTSRLLLAARILRPRQTLGELLASLSATVGTLGFIEWRDPDAPASLYWAASALSGFWGPDLFAFLRRAADLLLGAFIARWSQKQDPPPAADQPPDP